MGKREKLGALIGSMVATALLLATGAWPATATGPGSDDRIARPGNAGAGPGASPLATAPRSAPGQQLPGRWRVAARMGFVPRQLLVRFRPGARAEASAALRTIEAGLVRKLPLARLELVELRSGTPVRAAARALERRPEILYAEPNFVRRLRALPNDPRIDALWGLNNTGQTVQGTAGRADADIDAPEAWDLTTGSGDVVVAVLDSGIAYDHPDLAENMWRNPGETGGGKEANGIDDDGNGFVDDSRGWDFAAGVADNPTPPGDNDPYDEEGHGTHVAGTIGARGNNGIGVAGVNWSVSLMPVRVGEDGIITSETMIGGATYARDMGADVANMSFGFGFGYSQAEADAIAAAPGVLFVAATGNDRRNQDRRPDYPCSYPGRNLLCVAASDQRDRLARFSAFGRRSVDLAAPGRNTLSTVPPTLLQEILFEPFEQPLRRGWVTGGRHDTWGRERQRLGGGVPIPNGVVIDGEVNHLLADSPRDRYRNNTNSFVRMKRPLDLTGMSDCELSYFLRGSLERGVDFLKVEGSVDGAGWTEIASHTGRIPADIYLGFDLGTLTGQPGVRLRLRLISDRDGRRDGVSIDDLFVDCRGSYAFFEGTSMATPHVSGTAALLRARFPDASAAELRARLLGTVDRLPALRGAVASDGRLNAFRALTETDTRPPSTRITSGPSDPTRDRAPKFRFRSSEPMSSFECRIDSEPFGPCTASRAHKTGPLSAGRHRFEVTATDFFGNTDPTPARQTFRVIRA